MKFSLPLVEITFNQIIFFHFLFSFFVFFFFNFPTTIKRGPNSDYPQYITLSSQFRTLIQFPFFFLRSVVSFLSQVSHFFPHSQSTPSFPTGSQSYSNFWVPPIWSSALSPFCSGISRSWGVQHCLSLKLSTWRESAILFDSFCYLTTGSVIFLCGWESLWKTVWSGFWLQLKGFWSCYNWNCGWICRRCS